ncbi:MAG: hypothetical protein JW807_00110 [Spirochaetes bacterium]|nr:hypothetical protein [Spirochaetota bacterium]
MKYRCLICNTSIILLLCLPFGSGAHAGSWGYLLHTSRFSGEYLSKTLPGYSVICLTGFRLTDSGGLKIEASAVLKRITSLASKSKTAIYPLISFKTAAQGRRILDSPDLSQTAAMSIASMARTHGFPGIHLDFEYLPPSVAPKLSIFLGILRKFYDGKITMAIFPQVDFPESLRGFHDLKLIGSVLDEIVLMCYDLHGTHTGPGPVTSLSWAEKNIVHALSFVTPEKIWLGIPAYGYRWEGKKATPLPASKCARVARVHGAHRDSSGNMVIKYNESGRNVRIFYSDRETRRLLGKIASRYKLAGTALWRIGYED